MAKSHVPALDSAGWLEGIAEKAEKLFAYWLTSERSQSNFFENIASLPYLLQQHSANSYDLVDAVEKSLHSLFVDYFNDVSVEVEITSREGDPVDSPRKNMRINMDIIEGNERYDLSQMLAISNKTLEKVTDLNKE